jgi:class 3 adenylate cyclase
MPDEQTSSGPSSRWRRRQRVARLIRISARAVTIVCAVWVAAAMATGNWIILWAELGGLALAGAVLAVERRGHIEWARHLCMAAVFGLVLSVILLEGNRPERLPVVHLYLLCVAVGAFIVFFDAHPAVPAAWVGACLIVFLLRELQWLRFTPLAPVHPLVDRLAADMAFLAVFLVVIALINRFVGDIAAAERDLAAVNRRLEVVFESMLSPAVARRLRREGQTFADAHARCTVLFADLVGFTLLASERPPEQVVGLLDELFSRFDELTHEHGAETIKTIGDAYMAAAGVPEPRPDHAAVIARLALGMREAANALGLDIRIGIDSGPVVAGVIGKTRFVYDLWGDTVVVAAEVEAHGEPNVIRVTASTRRELASDFDLEAGGSIDLRDRPPMQTWVLRGPATAGIATR